MRLNYNRLTGLFILAMIVYLIGYHPVEAATFVRDLLGTLPREDMR